MNAIVPHGARGFNREAQRGAKLVERMSAEQARVSQ